MLHLDSSVRHEVIIILHLNRFEQNFSNIRTQFAKMRRNYSFTK